MKNVRVIHLSDLFKAQTPIRVKSSLTDIAVTKVKVPTNHYDVDVPDYTIVAGSIDVFHLDDQRVKVDMDALSTEVKDTHGVVWKMHLTPDGVACAAS